MSTNRISPINCEVIEKKIRDWHESRKFMYDDMRNLDFPQETMTAVNSLSSGIDTIGGTPQLKRKPASGTGMVNINNTYIAESSSTLRTNS